LGFVFTPYKFFLIQSTGLIPCRALGEVEGRLAFEAGDPIVLGFFDFFASSSPSTQADFAVRNYFFRTGVPRFLDFLVPIQ
jgi:hypothetical protein